MFGVPSISKLLVLVAVILIVWYGFKLVGRLDAARKTGAKQRSRLRPDALGVDTQQCRVCCTYVAPGPGSGCDRPDCPYV